MHYKETQTGFEHGAAKITRMCSDKKKGWVVLGLETPKYEGVETIQIYVTKTGKVRVSDSKGEWTPPEKK